MKASAQVLLRSPLFQTVLLTVESRKSSELLHLLEVNPDVGQKTVVITRSAQEVEEVFKVQQPTSACPLRSISPVQVCADVWCFQALSSISAFCLMVHEGWSHRLDSVMEQWRKDFGPKTHVLLGKPLML